MPENIWHITLDGVPLEGQYDRAQVQALLEEYPGRSLLVWKEGQNGWMEPHRLPEFGGAAQSSSPSQATAPWARSAPGPAAGLLHALTDFKVARLLNPGSLGALYGLAAIFAGIVGASMGCFGITSVISGIRFHAGGLMLRGFVVLLLAPMLAFLLLVVSRFFLEVSMILFQIKNRTR